LILPPISTFNLLFKALNKNESGATLPDQNKTNEEKQNAGEKNPEQITENNVLKPGTEKTENTDKKQEQKVTDSPVLKRKPLLIIYFYKNDYTVLPAYYKDLDKIAGKLLKDKTLKLLIEGHTDFEGSDSYNITLSDNRAMAVKKYILEKGNGLIDEKRMEVLFFGETRPVTDNTDEDKRQKNRRVELIIIQ